MLLVAALASAGCSGSDSVNNPGGGSGENPAGGTFLQDPNKGGTAQSIQITGVFWGRLVDIYDRTMVGPNQFESELQFTDFVIGDNIISDGVNFTLDANPITGQQELTILHEAGTPSYQSALTAVEANLQPIITKGVSVNEAPPFSAVPRNAAIVIRFNDLLDPATVNETSVQVRTGNPPSIPFEARIFPDPNHGGLAEFDSSIPGEEFYSTRVIIDTTVSQLEAQSTSLPVNNLGLPAAPSTNQANVGIFLPTKFDNVTSRIENPTDHPLSFSNNGPVLSGSLLAEVVRGFRSGLAADPNNGFLRDEVPPSIIGVQPMMLSNVLPGAEPGEFTLDASFLASSCAVDAEPGDVLQTGSAFAEVTAAVTLTGPTLESLPVRLISGTTLSAGSGDYLTVFQQNVDVPECFLRFNPPPQTPPATGVSTDADIIIRFSEPMDPASLQPFDSFTVTPANAASLSPFEQLVVGAVEFTPDLREFRFTPQTNLKHALGEAEAYLVRVAEDATDLAGNELTGTIGETSFTIAPGELPADTGGIVLTFDDIDQDGNGDSEISGNFLFNLSEGYIVPRSVSRFSVVLDSQQPMISPMQVFGFPIQTPHSNLGSKLQTVWRNVDMGLGLIDSSSFDIDVEGLNWAPFNGQVQIDNFSQFEMRLSHSVRQPDEALNPGLLPEFPISGLTTNFANNVLASPNSPQKVVHPKIRGYSIQPVNAFTSATGRTMVPWPMNEGLPPSQHLTWTYRDTSAREQGGPTSGGANPVAFGNIGGPLAGLFPAGAIPTIGLPLLMEFRCFPDDFAFAQNGIQIALAINSSARPNFRAFSTGGINQNGNAQVVDPDNEPVAQGGFNPANLGAQTQPTDNSFHFGQADFVVRVSRVHSQWFDTSTPTGVTWGQPVVEPNAQPTGTSLTLAWRGATSFAGNQGSPFLGSRIGAYGDYDRTLPNFAAAQSFTPVFVTGNPIWQSSLSSLDGARFVQFRATFVSNTETLLTPTLSAVGIPFTR